MNINVGELIAALEGFGPEARTWRENPKEFTQRILSEMKDYQRREEYEEDTSGLHYDLEEANEDIAKLEEELFSARRRISELEAEVLRLEAN